MNYMLCCACYDHSPFIEDHNVVVNPSKTFRLDEFKKAHEYVESAKGFGKVIFLVE